MSKVILDRILPKLRDKIRLVQWRNTDSVIDWFRKLENKSNTKFIQLDIDKYYPSITFGLLITVRSHLSLVSSSGSPIISLTLVSLLRLTVVHSSRNKNNINSKIYAKDRVNSQYRENDFPQISQWYGFSPV